MSIKSNPAQIIIANPDVLERLESRLERIEVGLQNFKVLPQDDFLSSEEFMAKVKIGKTKFYLLVSSGILQYRKIGKKIYVPKSQVAKYFAGDMNLSK